MSELSIPFVGLSIRFGKYREKLLETIQSLGDSGQWILGSPVSELEQELTSWCGCEHVVAVNSGFDALLFALKVLGVGPGDEVITAPNSFVASAAAIAATGATPVFSDVSEDYNLDPEKLADAITLKTKAIMPVHLTGMPVNMEPICELARSASVPILEDAAQAIGAKYRGRIVGSLGDLGCFSLNPLKNFHVFGDGGFVSTNNEQYAHRLKLLRNHGLINRDESVELAFNSRLDSIQAAMALVLIEELADWTDRFREIAERYCEGLSDVVVVPKMYPEVEPVFHNFIVRVPRRDELISYLATQGIEAKIHYPIPLHLQKACSHLGYVAGDFPVAEMLSGEIVSLPIYPELSNEQVERVIHAVRRFFDQ